MSWKGGMNMDEWMLIFVWLEDWRISYRPLLSLFLGLVDYRTCRCKLTLQHEAGPKRVYQGG